MAARQIIVAGAMPSRDANGRALPGLFRFYMPASGGIPAIVYADEARTIPHDFPIRSDSGGRWPQIWGDEEESFDVGWSDQVHDANIATFTNVQPVKDALLASADIANTAADAAIAAQEVSEQIAAKFGDVDLAIEAAQSAQEGAEAAETSANQILNGPDGVVELRNQTQVLRNEAQEFRDEAQEIAGFDPTTYVNTGAPQAFTDGAKKQARDNIAAQPLLGVMDREKVSRPAISGGVLTLDIGAASRFEVAWSANITDVQLVNVPAGDDSTSWTLVLIHGVSGPFTFAPGAEFHWVNDDTPTFATTNGDRNFLVMTTADGGDWVDIFPAGFTRA